MNKYKPSYAEAPHEIRNWKYGYPQHLFKELESKILNTMNEIKFNSQICTTKEQSQRLLDLGLKPETADMCWFNDMQKPFCAPYKCFVEKAQDMKWIIYPAWSLHRLLCMLYTHEDVYPIMTTTAYDDVIGEIEIEIKCGGFNKEYLKQ